MRPVEALKQIMPHCRTEYVQAFEKGDALFAQYGVNTSRRLAHFIAQFGAETGGGSILYENMNYTAERMMVIFGAKHSAKIVTRAEADALAHNPAKLAERVYGLGNPRKAKELGNTKPGDGYKYRGSGILQTTGGYNFKAAGDKVGVDFYTYPAAIVAPDHALKPALWEWGHSGCNALADAGNILGISKAINLGNSQAKGTPNGMTDRQTWFDRAWAVLKNQNVTLTPGFEATPPPVKPTPSVDAKLPKPSTPAPPVSKAPAATSAAGTVVATTGAVVAMNSTGFSTSAMIAVAVSLVIIGAIIGIIWHQRSS
jgi:putative chitinase